jgi:hypothetical protein
MENINFAVPDIPDPLLAEAYDKSASLNILRSVNHEIFHGYFSVCADGVGHGKNNTFPGLDWGQSAEALLWLGQDDVVRASWEYVKSFQREDGLIPFAIIPDQAGKTVPVLNYPLKVEDRGAVYVHWEPGNALFTLSSVTYIEVADSFFRRTGDLDWLRAQAGSLRRTIDWMETSVNDAGLVKGGGFYIERPPRHDFDGVSQCYNVDAYRQAARLFDRVGDEATARRCRALAERISASFRAKFWAGDQCVEYLHPKRGPITSHGLTDVDWIAIATHTLAPAHVPALWERLRGAADFVYGGTPTGIATRPEAYEDWELTSDRHDVAAMGRAWFLEAWARREMGDADGLVDSLRKVSETGRANGWSWHERYYSERSGDLGLYKMEWYVEYPACLIRVINRFLLGIGHGLDGSLRIDPLVPAAFWEKGFGHRLAWTGRTLSFRCQGEKLSGTVTGAQPLRLRVRPGPKASSTPSARINGRPIPCTLRNGLVELELPPSSSPIAFEVSG